MNPLFCAMFKRKSETRNQDRRVSVRDYRNSLPVVSKQASISATQVSESNATKETIQSRRISAQQLNTRLESGKVEAITIPDVEQGEEGPLSPEMASLQKQIDLRQSDGSVRELVNIMSQYNFPPQPVSDEEQNLDNIR